MGDEYRAEKLLHELRVIVHVLVRDSFDKSVNRGGEVSGNKDQSCSLERRIPERLDDFRTPGREHADARGLYRIYAGTERAGYINLFNLAE